MPIGWLLTMAANISLAPQAMSKSKEQTSLRPCASLLNGHQKTQQATL
jgi:hypothetical protein